MPTNSLLLRWSGGWHDGQDNISIAIYGRKEGYLSVGAQQSAAEVDRIATRELQTLAYVKQQTTVEHLPQTLAETPYIGYLPGDSVVGPDFAGMPNPLFVQAMTVLQDDDGELIFQPKIGDSVLGLDEADLIVALAQNQRKLANGALAGLSRIASRFSFDSTPIPTV